MRRPTSTTTFRLSVLTHSEYSETMTDSMQSQITTCARLIVLATLVKKSKLIILDPSLWPASIAANMVTNQTSGFTQIQNCVPYQNYVNNEGLTYDNTM